MRTNVPTPNLPPTQTVEVLDKDRHFTPVPSAKWVDAVMRWFQGYLMSLAASNNFTVGSAVASATTITISNNLTHVTGTAAIQTINTVPNFAGDCIYLINDAGFTLTTGGNINVAVTPTVGHAVALVWSTNDSKWYPV